MLLHVLRLRILPILTLIFSLGRRFLGLGTWTVEALETTRDPKRYTWDVIGLGFSKYFS